MASSFGDHGIFTIDEFYNRGVIKLAPDVLVYIGGSLQTTVLAPVVTGNNTISFNDGITNVSIQNNVDPPGSSTANIEVVTPIYGPSSNYWTTYDTPNGKVRAPVFVPMLEIKIYLKGRFMVDMKPRYYPAFWGFITQVDENFSGGIYKFTLNCADMLHWWAYSSLNVHPVPESNIYASGKQGLTVYSTVFKRANPYNILYTLNTQMGMLEFVTPSWVAQKTSASENYPADLFAKAAKGIMEYWAMRFKTTRPSNYLKMYGLDGTMIQLDENKKIRAAVPKGPARNTGGNSDVGQGVDPKDVTSYNLDIKYLNQFEIFADYDQMGTFENAEYTTKLDIATEIKTRCNFEFFQDTNGNYIFKPPFYNINVKGMVPYTLLPSDIISYSMNTDVGGIITVMNVTTPMYKNIRTTPYVLGQGFHMDVDLVKKYGVRFRSTPMEYVNNSNMARTLAVGQMTQINAKTITGNVTIPGRPEIRLGYPIYMEHRDSFHYVKSINHSFDYGGTFTTTLSLEMERKQLNLAEITLKSDSVKDNKDLIYRLKNKPLKEDNSTAYGREQEKLKAQAAALKVTDAKNKKDAQDKLEADKKKNAGWNMMTQTVQDKEEEAAKKKVSVPAKITDRTPNSVVGDAVASKVISSGEPGLYEIRKRGEGDLTKAEKEQQITTTTYSIPYTDEDGYKLIGSFPYGRNLNPILVSAENIGTSAFKDVYLTTMARPVYQSESDAMSTLFFKTEEGAVPNYLNTELTLPSTLGLIKDTFIGDATTISTPPDKVKDEADAAAKKLQYADKGQGTTKSKTPTLNNLPSYLRR